MTTQERISQPIQDILGTFPTSARKQALAAIESGGDWEEELEPYDEGVGIY